MAGGGQEWRVGGAHHYAVQCGIAIQLPVAAADGILWLGRGLPPIPS